MRQGPNTSLTQSISSTASYLQAHFNRVVDGVRERMDRFMTHAQDEDPAVTEFLVQQELNEYKAIQTGRSVRTRYA